MTTKSKVAEIISRTIEYNLEWDTAVDQIDELYETYYKNKFIEVLGVHIGNGDIDMIHINIVRLLHEFLKLADKEKNT